jgi:hypothetical protein
MKRFTFLLLLIPFFSSAQFRNNIWCFGDSAGIDFSNLNNPIPISTSLDTRGSCVSISDSLGNLLFYANTRAGVVGCHTTQIRNSQHQLMDNGDSIVGEGWYKELIIIPINNGSNNLFYIFSSSIIGCQSGFEGLYYSIIDMSYNGGLGKVINKNIQLINFQPCDGLAAIKHGNGRDWWLLFRKWEYSTNEFGEFYSFLVQTDSLIGPFVQQIGSLANNSGYSIEPSDDGLTVACAELRGLIEFFDFDRCTGLLSNPITIEQSLPFGSPNFPKYISCQLSPLKTKLYVSSIYQGPQSDSSYLYQFDLLSPNISNSKTKIFSSKSPATDGLLKLAPDNKIYFSSAYEPGVWNYPYDSTMYDTINKNLSVINYPDSVGLACNFQPYSFNLGGKRTYWGLPNNPNYDLTAWGGSICDTLGLPNHVDQGPPTTYKNLTVFYHPSWQTAFINASGLQGKNYSLHLINLEGKEIAFETGVLSSEYFTRNLPCNNLSAGVYFVLFETEKDTLAKKFIIE